MALKLGNATTRKLTVEAIEPLDFGKTQTHRFDVELEVIPKTEWESLFKGSNPPSDSDVLGMTLKDITGLVDEANNPITFDATIKSAVLESPWLVSAIVEQQVALQMGKTAAEYKRLKLKN